MPPFEKNQAIEWLAKTAGLVDRVCCYSYSEKQIYSEEPPVQMDASSWDDMEENSITQKPSFDKFRDAQRYPEKQGDRLLSARNFHPYQYQCDYARGEGDDGTATTVTTSTAPTMITSLRTSDGNSLVTAGQSFHRQQQQQQQMNTCNNTHTTRTNERRKSRRQRDSERPQEIYLHAHSGDIYETRGPLFTKPIPSLGGHRQQQQRPFGSVTEGYQC